MRSYIIHMRGDAKRQDNVKVLLANLPDAEIADAVVGRDVQASEGFPITAGNMYSPHYPFELSAGEVGCFLSHRNCWQKIVDAGIDYALIAEDDLAVEPHIWPEVLELIQLHADADTYIRIPAKPRERPASIIAERPHARLFLPRVIGLQTVCQVVGRNAAQRLLEKSTTLDRPVDTFLQMHWATGQQIHTILPNGVRELTDELGGSTIQKKTRTSGKLARELKRAWYRTQVNLRPQRV